MGLRRLLAGTVGGLGLVAATNRFLTQQAEQLRAPLGRSTEEYRWRGFDIAYTEAGSPDDQDLLLLHGLNAAGSSAEFAAVFDSLTDEYHVIAPDLPGFGLSDRPPLLYSPSLYVTFITDFIRDMTDEPRVVGSSVTGAYATMAAETEAVSSLVLVCPTTTTMPGNRTWLRSVLRSPVIGEGLFNLMTSKSSLRHFSADHGLYDSDTVDAEYIEYRWQTTHQPGARFAPASFFSGALDPDVELGTALAELDVPVRLVWGRNATTTPLTTGQSLASHADAELAVFDDAMLLPHVEHPQGFTDVVADTEGADNYLVD
ncbi:alpha/beta fold hydrolase [Halocatena pleomorpha]|uniref:Alpha/beta hydrolase n=1 Tax=Halocatena pleomorpha TaxID=1785090 RepID=A0A3P3R6P9_9EURY|nr:alpha/beta hydrolase [Halocatena pleomorpha]RRJ29045.1 alpha/beta hydrolase [Halocatena pleomorpha]